MDNSSRRVLAVIGSSLAIFWPGAFIFGYPGVMGPYWQKMFGVGRGPIGNSLFFVLAAVGIFMFFVGRWQEKLGTRKMISIGAFLCGTNTLFAAYVTNLFLLYLWAFLNGLASCFIYLPALTTVQRWYPHKKGLVSGVVNLAFGISAAVMAPLFGWLFHWLGYVSMNQVLAVAALVIGVLAAQFTEVPEQIIGSNAGDKARPASLAVQAGTALTVRESLRTKNFWFLWLTWALQGSAGIAMVTLSVNFGLSKGMAMTSAVLILTAFNVTNGLSRLVMGYLSDRLPRNKAMGLTFLAAGCSFLVLGYLDNFMVILLLSAVIGFAFGTLFAVSAPLVSDCFGLKHFGAVFGLVFTAYGFLAGPLGPSLSGYLLDLTEGSFLIVFTYLGLFCLLSSILIRRVVPFGATDPSS